MMARYKQRMGIAKNRKRKKEKKPDEDAFAIEDKRYWVRLGVSLIRMANLPVHIRDLMASLQTPRIRFRNMCMGLDGLMRFYLICPMRMHLP